MTKPEERARRDIDRLVTATGWAVQDMAEENIHATRGVFAFHRPETLLAPLDGLSPQGATPAKKAADLAQVREHPVRARTADRHHKHCTPLVHDGLWKINEFGQKAKHP